MITKEQYLKSYYLMNEEEKSEYDLSLIRWTDETYPRLCALADAWTDADVKDFDEGLRLASAFNLLHPYIAAAYRYDAKTRVKKLGGLLSQLRSKTSLAKKATRPANDDTVYVGVLPTKKKVDENGVVQAKKAFEMPEVDGRRPEHLSQYIHKLSSSLQKESKNLENWYLQLASHKEKAILLANDPRAAQEDIKREAKETVRVETLILNFWERVDLEWQALTGNTIDEDAVAALEDEAAKLNRQVPKSAGEYTKAEIDAMDDEEMQENCRRARIEANKKYVRRTDVQMSEDRKEQIKLRIAELLAWGADVPAKAKELCRKYDIQVEGFVVDEPETDDKPAKGVNC